MWSIKCLKSLVSEHLATINMVIQPVITTRIFVLHKITMALKFMSYVKAGLPIPVNKLQTPGWPECAKLNNDLEAGRT